MTGFRELFAVCLGILILHAPMFASAQPARMSDSRLLRRAYLTILGRGPTIEEYEVHLSLPAEERRAAVTEFAAEAMETPRFAYAVRKWGSDYLGVPGYRGASNRATYRFDGALSMELEPCPSGSLHAGHLGLFSNVEAGGDETYGQSRALCNEATAPRRDIEPWWAPGTTVPTIGDVALETRVSTSGEDCGANRVNFRAMDGCGCGPHLVYCLQRGVGEEGDYHLENSMRRQVHEEPARLFEHIVMHERPFSDLVLGNYTVATRTLQMAYVRQARMTPETAPLDDEPWWRAYGTAPDRWREISIHQLNPYLLAERDYRFDPRTEPGRPRGVPAAGVLTTIVANEAWPRERVRAASWLRSLGCREFSPPASGVSFPPYERDPAREGPCLTCHQTIDPAAMYFKRLFDSGVLLAGVTDTWSLDGRLTGASYRLEGHASGAMIADTLMTPVSAAQLTESSDRRFIDFMPPGTTLLGQQGSGTIGPLGFAEVLVESGEFDRCAVRRAYRRFGGRDLVPGRDDVLLAELYRSFVGSERSMKRLIGDIVRGDEFALGL